ncbi:hypothetical protein FA048_16895 [Pedobacter polaris]|uniref:Carboxypeptidase-like regulatory domain-containing protein n=1 Tax=Pedobacter polaris TaxID=2571273 RepID=A0A4U1CG71_9SPHI|nr:hypothetical protein [Pedobacter polaris]TKC05405.1 hypothetical protein FA048_16895 [Pedobacter polaris]
MLKKLILLLLITSPFKLLAQNNILTGDIFDNDNRNTSIQGATIKNLSTKTFALSDKDGHFSIVAKIGDLVSFGMSGFQTDTVYLTNLFPKNVYLRVEVNNLKTVDINGVKTSPYLGNLGNPDNKPPVKSIDYSKERGGFRLNLGYGKWRKEQIKVQELEEIERYQTEINKNFNEEYIKAAVKFEGPGIKDFISLYRPTVDQIKAERPFNYAYYTVKAYHAWLKLPADQRHLPPLIKPKTSN